MKYSSVIYNKVFLHCCSIKHCIRVKVQDLIRCGQYAVTAFI